MVIFPAMTKVGAVGLFNVVVVVVVALLLLLLVVVAASTNGRTNDNRR